MEPKYKLLPKKRVTGRGLSRRKSKLYQIEALRDIPRYGVKAGDLGGYVNSAECLSQEGDCWIREGSIVLSGYRIYGSVIGNALIEGSYLIDNSIISHGVVISGHDGKIMNSEIGGTSKVFGKTEIDFCNFEHDVHIEHSDVETELASNFYLLVDRETIVIHGSKAQEGRIYGYGKLRVESNARFDLEGGFDIEFNDELNASFEARGKVSLQNVEFINCPVKLAGEVRINSSTISGSMFNMETDRGIIQSSTFNGMTKISGTVNIKHSKFEGENTLDGNIVIGALSSLRGTNTVLGNTLLPSGSYLINKTISNGNQVVKELGKSDEAELKQLKETLTRNIKIGSSATPVQAISSHDLQTAITANSDQSSRVQEHVNLIQSIEAEYEAYTTDIVKLIKYPAMGDSSVPETRNFVVALRAAQRAVKARHTETLGTIAGELEHAFVEAESKAIILAASFMDDKRKQSLKKAGSALAIALDENANEHERRAGYKSGMKSLEGVLPVSEQAVSVLKERIGLKEIEA